jgi:penicillin-binding protein 2
LGMKLGTDISGEKPGNVPVADYFHKIHGYNKWNYSRIISMSIGQGELLLTPMQMANATAMVANRGFFYTPHFIRASDIPNQYRKKHESGIDKKNYVTVIGGMRGAMTNGTGAYVQIPGITICGKTGTAQNPHGENHSIFIAFAPMDNPQIAIAAVVENAGYGSTWAAPICTLMIEKYINRDTVSQRPELEVKMMETAIPRR